MPGRSRCRRTTSASRPSVETVQSPQGNGTIKGYFARPANASGKLPAVLVVHENRGLNPYIEDVARRFARRELHRVGARRPDLGRRLSRATTRRARRCSGRSTAPKMAKTSRRRPAGSRRVPNRTASSAPSASASAAAWSTARRADGRGSRRGGAVLRPAAERRGRGEDQGADRWRTTPANDPGINAGMPGLRGGAQGERQDRTRSSCTKARSTASTTTRRRATTKRRRSSPGRGRSSSSTRTCGHRRWLRARASGLEPRARSLRARAY